MKIVPGFESGDFFHCVWTWFIEAEIDFFFMLFYYTGNITFQQCWDFFLTSHVFQHISLFFLPISYEITVKRKHVKVMMALSFHPVSISENLCM